MTLKVVKAYLACDACGFEYSIILDPAEAIKDSTLSDEVDKEIGTYFDITIQHDMHLCRKCTSIADSIGDDEYQPTRDEILQAIRSVEDG